MARLLSMKEAKVAAVVAAVESGQLTLTQALEQLGEVEAA